MHCQRTKFIRKRRNRSVSFITFILELEERLTEEFETSFELLLDEIPGFSVDNPSLSIEGLIDYLRIKISLDSFMSSTTLLREYQVSRYSKIFC